MPSILPNKDQSNQVNKYAVQLYFNYFVQAKRHTPCQVLILVSNILKYLALLQTNFILF